MNKVKCRLCGKEFQQITSTHLKKSHNITFSEYKIKFPDEETLIVEARNKISQNAKNLNQLGKMGFKTNHKINSNKTPWNKGKKGVQIGWSKGKNKENCISLKNASEKLSAKRKLMFKQGKLKRKLGIENPMYGKKLTEEHKQALWSGWKNCFTKPERKMIKLLEPYNEWSYVGNGKFYIKTNKQIRIPDFINKNKKRIIEVYGNYWHKGENPNDKISEYNEVGWDCVVLWEDEIMSGDFDLNKIKYFL